MLRQLACSDAVCYSLRICKIDKIFDSYSARCVTSVCTAVAKIGIMDKVVYCHCHGMATLASFQYWDVSHRSLQFADRVGVGPKP